MELKYQADNSNANVVCYWKLRLFKLLHGLVFSIYQFLSKLNLISSPMRIVDEFN